MESMVGRKIYKWSPYEKAIFEGVIVKETPKKYKIKHNYTSVGLFHSIREYEYKDDVDFSKEDVLNRVKTKLDIKKASFEAALSQVNADLEIINNLGR